MFTFMKLLPKLSTDTVEVGGATFFHDGNTRSVDGSEMYTWSSLELEWTWWRTNLTIYVLSGFLQMMSIYQQETKNGFVVSETNS